MLLMPTPAQHADIIGIDEIGDCPALEIVFGHALVRKALPALVLARGERSEQRVAADFLVAAGVVDLIEFVARAELCANRIPQELHQLDALDRRDAARASDID